jgi:hypothetical protein
MKSSQETLFRFVLFLNQLRLESFTLFRIHLSSEEACRAVEAAGLQVLELDACKFEDRGAALVESVREGFRLVQGDLTRLLPFASLERFNSFVSAPRSNAYLERLDLRNSIHRQVPQALTAALR